MELDDDVEFHHGEKLYPDKRGYAKMDLFGKILVCMPRYLSFCTQLQEYAWILSIGQVINKSRSFYRQLDQ